MCHYNAPDEESHAHNTMSKVKAIENFDKEILGQLLKYLNNKYPNNYRISLMPDHYTLLKNGQHLDDPVPFVLYGKDVIRDEVEQYSERNILNKDVIKSYELMERIIN